jgi:hypothetical protein
LTVVKFFRRPAQTKIVIDAAGLPNIVRLERRHGGMIVMARFVYDDSPIWSQEPLAPSNLLGIVCDGAVGALTALIGEPIARKTIWRPLRRNSADGLAFSHRQRKGSRDAQHLTPGKKAAALRVERGKLPLLRWRLDGEHLGDIIVPRCHQPATCVTPGWRQCDAATITRLEIPALGRS